MSVEAGDTVYVVWNVYEGEDGLEIRKLKAIAEDYAAAVLAAGDERYRVEEWIVK